MEHKLYSQEELDRYRSTIDTQEKEIKEKLEILKAEAKNLGGLRKELSDEKKAASQVITIVILTSCIALTTQRLRPGSKKTRK